MNCTICGSHYHEPAECTKGIGMTPRIDVIGQNGNDGEHYDAGRKFDGEKPAMDLMPPLMEIEVAKVLTFGAMKYDAENWRYVDDLHARYRSAAKRHINALKQGQMVDPESGLHHAAHAVCCLMFIGEIDLEILATQPGRKAT